jgi:hypothetical protein
MSCSSGCLTQDHKTYGECLRAKNTRVAYCNSASGRDYTSQKRADQELDLYASAVKQGHDPENTGTAASLMALEYGERTGSAYQPTQQPDFLTGPAANEGVFA